MATGVRLRARRVRERASHERASLARGLLPGASFRASPHADERPQGEAGRVTLAVIHFISLPAGRFGGPWVDRLFLGRLDRLGQRKSARPGIRDLRELRGLRVSAHLFIRRRGRVIQYVNLLRRAWHVGLSNFRGRDGANAFSVGIELEGTGEAPFTRAQYRALAGALRRIARALPVAFVTGHETIAPGRKTDPGPFFDWARLCASLPKGVRLALAPDDCDRGMLARRAAALAARAKRPSR